jgi:carboxymethylenebutenolidase
VLILHVWWGLTDFFKGTCDRLAANGFVAFAPDLRHGKTVDMIEEAELAWERLLSFLFRNV